MAKRTTRTRGNPIHQQVRAAFRGERMFLDAFEHAPVLDPTELTETLRRVRKGSVNKEAVFKSLLQFTAMVKMVGEMSALFGPSAAMTLHGLDQEDLDFVVACWKRAGRPTSGASVGW